MKHFHRFFTTSPVKNSPPYCRFIQSLPRESGDGVADGALVEAPEVDGELSDLGPPGVLQAAQSPALAHEVVWQRHPTDPVDRQNFSLQNGRLIGFHPGN